MNSDNKIGMRKINYHEYMDFVTSRKEIIIGNSIIKLNAIKIDRIIPNQEELTDITTTVWSFPKRGSWATHRGNYRGNWPPQMARGLILMYTRPGDTVVDPMMGSGTTCIEAKLLGRNCIGVDINYNAVMLAYHRIHLLEEYLMKLFGENQAVFSNYTNDLEMPSIKDIMNAKVELYHGDARNLDKINDSSIDLVATHPPYFNIIKYSRSRIEGDLSSAKNMKEYLAMIREVSKEAYRILKPGRHMAILVGDTRSRRHYVPITHYVLEILLRTGFILREEIVKIQHKMRTTGAIWSRIRNRDFLLIYHEKLYVLRKPLTRKDYSKYKYSSYLDLDDILEGF